MDQFLLEMMMSNMERGLYQALLENPYDQATRNAYVDFLKENNRHENAKQVAEGFTFRRGYMGNSSTELSSGTVMGRYFPLGGFASGDIASFTYPSGALMSGLVSGSPAYQRVIRRETR